ncbi:MAG: hypothetical protein ACR2MN_17020 [Acidimicrobiales bacterium]
MIEGTAVTEMAGLILEHALGDETAAAIQRAEEIGPGTLGDWCDACADDDDVDPVRFPRMIFGEMAVYICHRCGHRWTCWWALDTGEAA